MSTEVELIRAVDWRVRQGIEHVQQQQFLTPAIVKSVSYDGANVQLEGSSKVQRNIPVLEGMELVEGERVLLARAGRMSFVVVGASAARSPTRDATPVGYTGPPLIGLEDNAGLDIDPDPSDRRIQFTDDGIINADRSGNTIALSIAEVQIDHGNIGGVLANQHHNQAHGIVSSDHTVTGSQWDVVGLTGTNTLGILTPSYDPGAAAALLRTDPSGHLQLSQLRLGVDDTTVGTLLIYGGGTGTNEGGEIQLFLGADFDATFETWKMDVWQDDLRFFTGDAAVINKMTAEGQLQLPTTGSGGGILVSDTQLYRDAANVWGMPDSLRLIQEGADSASARNVTFRKDRNGSIVQNNDDTGVIFFEGWDGDEYHRTGAIRSQVDGTPGDDDMPGRLVFQTVADGATALTEAMRIDSSQNVLIGLTTAVGGKLEVRATTEQARFEYDASNYASVSVSSLGTLTVTSTGTTANMVVRPAGALYLEAEGAGVFFRCNQYDNDFMVQDNDQGSVNYVIWYDYSAGKVYLGNTGAADPEVQVRGALQVDEYATITDATTAQLTLKHDVSNYVSYTVGGGGNLTIEPTGGGLIVSGEYLHMDSASNTYIRLEESGSDRAEIRYGVSADSLIFYTTNLAGTLTQRLYIDGEVDEPDVHWTNVNGMGIGLTATPSAMLEVRDTTEQVRMSYDGSNVASFTVGGTGTLEIDTTSNIVLDPGGNNVNPGGAVEDDLGAYNAKWRTLYAAELYVETLVAQDVMSTIGGRIIVAPTTTLAEDVASIDTSFDVEDASALAVNDYIYLCSSPGGVPQVEAMQITGISTSTLTVTRNLDGSGANDWKTGDAVVLLGYAANEGYLELTSTQTIHSHLGPTIAIYSRSATTNWDDVKPVVALGNLDSFLGYGEVFGLAIGNDLSLAAPTSSSFRGATLDRTNGLQLYGTNITLYDSSTPKVQIVYNEGLLISSGTWGTDTTVFAAVFADDGTVTSLDAGDVIIGTPFHATATSRRGLHWDNSTATLYISADSQNLLALTGSDLEFYSNSAVTLSFDGATGDATFGVVDTSKYNLFWDASEGDLALRLNITNRILLDGGADAITVGASTTGNVYITSTSVQIRDGTDVYTDLTGGALTLGLVSDGEYIKVSDTSGLQVYDSGTEWFRVGDLNGNWGYSSSTLGMAIGEYGASKMHVVFTGGVTSFCLYTEERMRINTAGLIRIGDTSGSNTSISISDSQIQMRSGTTTHAKLASDGTFWFGDTDSTERIQWDTTNGLVIYNASGTATIKAPTSGNVQIVGSLTVESGGYIQVGSGTKDSDLTGFIMDDGEFVGQSAGTDQFYISAADGKAYAGGGNVILDSDGIWLAAGTGAANSVRWLDGSDLVCQLYAYGGATARTTLLATNIDGLDDAQLYLQAASYSHGSVTMSLITDGDSYLEMNSGGNFYIELGDNAGANWFKLQDNYSSQVFKVDSDGELTLTGDALLTADARVGGGLYVGGTSTDPVANWIELDGAIHFHAEISTPSAPAANGCKLYLDDNGGKTRLMALFSSGAAQVVATQP